MYNVPYNSNNFVNNQRQTFTSAFSQNSHTRPTWGYNNLERRAYRNGNSLSSNHFQCFACHQIGHSFRDCHKFVNKSYQNSGYHYHKRKPYNYENSLNSGQSYTPAYEKTSQPLNWLKGLQIIVGPVKHLIQGIKTEIRHML